MATIPIVERKLQVSGIGTPTQGFTMPTRTVNPGSVEARQMRAPTLDLPTAQFDASPYRALNEAGKVLMEVGQEAKKRGDSLRLIEAQRQLDDFEANTLYGKNGPFTRKGKDAMNLPNDVTAEYDGFADSIYESLANDDQRLQFREMAYSRRQNILRSALRHEREQLDAYAESETNAAVESSVNRAVTYYTNPDMVDASIKNAQDVYQLYGRQKGMSPEEIANKQGQIESKARLGVLTRLADSSPQGAITYYQNHQSRYTAEDLLAAQRLMAPTTRKYKATELARQAMSASTPIESRDDAINFVMNDLEGGDKIITDSNGAVAKFGINQKANPDLKVAELTPEQARAAYKERYWDKLGIDALPADMRLIAFDTAVNQGPEKARELIDAAGGDAAKLLELRAQEYQRLAKNPEYAPYLEGWMNRLSKLSAQTSLMRGEPPSELDLYARIDAAADDLEVASDAKALVTQNLKLREQAQKQAWEDASRAAYTFIQQGMEVPASVEARMNPKDVADMRKNAPPDLATYEALRNRINAGEQVDLGQYRWRLGSKYLELSELMADPSKQADARKVDDVLKSATGILIGRANPKSEDDFRKVEKFRRRVDLEIADLKRQSGGKPATAQDVQAITDRLLLKVDPEGWGGDDYLFNLAPETAYEIPGITAKGQYYDGQGNAVPYPMLVAEYTKVLRAKGLEITTENLERVHKEALAKGVTKVKDVVGRSVPLTTNND